MLPLKGKNAVISIILPFKNEERFLAECIQSIIDQTLPNWELILVDDNSTDESLQIAEKFAKIDKRVRVFSNPSAGVIAAMQHGFKQSTGNLITRMDGDDIKTHDNLEQLFKAVSPGTLAVGQVQYFRSDGLGQGYGQYQDWINKCTQSNNSFSEIYKECVIPSPCWLAHRDDFLQAGGFESNLYPEDYDLCFRFYHAGLKTKGTEAVIHMWRDHSTRTTRVSQYYSDNRFMELKMRYFNLIDYNKDKTLVLWGAGKKGKTIAKHWSENNMRFTWLTNNQKKIGHNIYGFILQSPERYTLNDSNQVIIAVADKQGQLAIKESLNGSGAAAYWFC